MLHSIRDTAPRRALLLAAAFTAILPSIALAGSYKPDPGTTTKITNQQAQWQAQTQWQRQYQDQSQKAYGGAGGAGGQGGNGYGGGATANNAGNTQQVSFDSGNHDQPGGFGLPSYASGSCVGASYSAGLGFSMFTIAGGASTIEDQCQLREFVRINQNGNAEQQKMAMDVDRKLYGMIMGTPAAAAGTQTSATPAATAPIQTADAASTCAPNLPKALQMQCEAK